MRIPLAVNLESRDGTLDQDALVKNGIIERVGETFRLRKRPGLTSLGATTATDTTQGIFWWPPVNRILMVKNDTIYSSPVSSFSTTSTSAAGWSGDKRTSFVLGSPVADSGSDVFALLKSETLANRITGDIASAAISDTNITDADYPDATYTPDRLTVPGCLYLDGYYLVMTTFGEIFNSALNDATSWGALDYTTAAKEGSPGTGLARTNAYVVAFKEWSTEVFYNAGNPTGSILSPVPSGFLQVGCPDGWSIAEIDDKIVFIGQSKAEGRGVYVMQGLRQQRVSTAAVDRVLELDTLATVYSYALKVYGQTLYVLTLTNTAVTLVYNLTSDTWTQWTSLVDAANKSVTSITRSGTTATVTVNGGHGMSDGDPVTIAGADQAGYNITAQLSYVSSTVFTIEVDSGTVSPATGTITATPYTETYFKFTHYAYCDGTHVFMHETDGDAYAMATTTYRDDATIPINYFARTLRLDGGTTDAKKLSRLGVIGDKVSDTAMIRWSDDDSTTFTKYRRVTLSNATPELRRCGAFERRSIEFRHVGNTAPVIDALELDIGR